MIYLDNNATTACLPEVKAAMLPFWDEWFANPSANYEIARKSALAVSDARAAVAHMMGGTPEEVVFTSGGTESNATAFHLARVLRPDRRHAVVTAVEHEAVLAAAQHWEKTGGRVTYLPVSKDGELDTDLLDAALTPDTALCSVMAANNETGACFPIESVAALAAAKEVWFHCDATQAYGKIPLPRLEDGVRLWTASAHKFHGPKGIGALMAQGLRDWPPLIDGGGQEQGRRSGTENVPAIVGMGVAADAADAGVSLMADVIRPLRDDMEQRLRSRLPSLVIASANAPRLPNTALLMVPSLPSDIVLARLDMEGVCCSSGSACATGAAEPSHVLTAMQVPTAQSKSAVRVSLSRHTNVNEIDIFVERFGGIVRSLA